MQLKPEYEKYKKVSFVVFTCLYWLAAILYYVQLGVIILIIVDAFHYIPGGLAEQNCPNGLNNTFCSTAWKATTIISISYVYEAIGLTYVISCIYYRVHTRKKQTTNPTNQKNRFYYVKRYFRISCTRLFPAPSLKLNIYLFAIIALLFTTKVTVTSIAFTTIGGFIVPIFATAYEVVSHMVQPKPDVKAPDADDVGDVEAPNADDVGDVEAPTAPNADDVDDVEAPNADDVDDVEAPNADDVDDVEASDVDDVDDVEAPNADDVDDVEASDVDDVDDVEAPNADDVDDVEASDVDDVDDVEAPNADDVDDVEAPDEVVNHTFQMVVVAEVPPQSPNFNVSDGDGD